MNPSSRPNKPWRTLPAVLGLVFLLAAFATAQTTQPAAPRLKYEKRATREETQKAALLAHKADAKDGKLDPRLQAALDYRLSLDFPKSPEDRYYPMVTIPLPDDVVLEVGGMDFRKDGKLAVCTRRGEVWLVENALQTPPVDVKFTQFAFGLHEALGLAVRDDGMYVVQRGEVTRIHDSDGDDRADVFETVCPIPITGDYHEYAFHCKFDNAGQIWITLNVGFGSPWAHKRESVPWRGWAVTVDPKTGKMTPVCGGLRSPNGMGFNAEGDAFYDDNQGEWVGSGRLSHLKEGMFMGHAASVQWYDRPESPAKSPGKPRSDSNQTMYDAKKTMPQLQLPAVFLPHGKVGGSSADIICDLTGGRFGPFGKQLFVGDQSGSVINRVFLEKVGGEYQGAVFPFRKGFQCGTNRLKFAPDGSLLVGETNRGWGSSGGKPYGLQRLVKGEGTPLEVLEMRARPDGFELTFTRPVDRAKGADAKSYTMNSYSYSYHDTYGSKEIHPGVCAIRGVTLSDDGLKATLIVENLREGFVHELRLPGVQTPEGEKILHDVAYYTLNAIPK